MDSKPPIFILGCPRSGTSLLRRLLLAHPSLAIPPESHFIPKLYRQFGNPNSPEDAKQLAHAILRLSHVKRWGIDAATLQLEQCRSFAEIIAAIFRAYAKSQNKTRWGDKTPQYAAEIPTLTEIFPNCQIIHIYRDGRDVALSWIKTPFGPENTYSAALQWKRFVSSARTAGSTLPAHQYFEIRYESLLSNPAEILQSVYRFLGEQSFDNMVQPQKIANPKELRIFGKSDRNVSLQKDIVSDNSNKWQREMSERQRHVFAATAGELLRELGYECDSVRVPLSKTDRLLYRTHGRVMENLKRFNNRRLPGRLIDISRIAWLRSRIKARDGKTG